MPSSAFVIAHATDLSPEGGIALRHGVALARHTGARLVSLFANPTSPDDAGRIPDGNTLLRRAGDRGTIDHDRRAPFCCEEPVETLLRELFALHPALLVVGTRRPTGVTRLLNGSTSETLALESHLPTLFLPIGGHGFVDDGSVELNLRRVLVVARSVEGGQAALDGLVAFLERLQLPRPAAAHVLHVGVAPTELRRLDRADIRWVTEHGEEPLLTAVVDACDRLAVDLVVMATHGHDSLADLFWGSRTEQVVRAVSCPVYAVPMG